MKTVKKSTYLLRVQVGTVILATSLDLVTLNVDTRWSLNPEYLVIWQSPVRGVLKGDNGTNLFLQVVVDHHLDGQCLSHLDRVGKLNLDIKRLEDF